MIRSEWKGISVCILRQLQCLPARSSYYSTCRPIHMSANVCVVPTPAVSYSVCHPNTCRQLQCLSFQHLPSATMSVVQHPPSATVYHPNTRRQLQCIIPTPAVSYSVSFQHPPSATVYRPNTRRQLQCIIPTPAVSYSVSSQHPPSATVYHPNTRRQLQCIVTTPAVSYSVSSQHLPSATVYRHNTRRQRKQRLVLVST